MLPKRRSGWPGSWCGDGQTPLGAVDWCAEEVELEMADAEDAERLRARSQFCKQMQVWEQQREYERNVRKHLGEDVLKTTGSAIVWWLARHTEDVQGAARLIEDLRKLSAASHEGNGTRSAAPGQPPSWTVNTDNDCVGEKDLALTCDLLDTLFPESGDERTMFASWLAMIAERSGQETYARRVRSRFGLPSLDDNTPVPAPSKPHEL
jgi:hypothetical protein